MFIKKLPMILGTPHKEVCRKGLRSIVITIVPRYLRRSKNGMLVQIVQHRFAGIIKIYLTEQLINLDQSIY